MQLKKSDKETIKKIGKNKGLFLSLFDKLLNLKHLKLFKLAIGFVKGFSVEVEFFEEDEEE